MNNRSKKIADQIRKARKTTNAKAIIAAIQEQSRVALSQAITLLESTLPSDQKIAREIVDGCLSCTTNSIRIGITGVPGVGKSTFIEALGNYLIENHHRVAVLAIDPSSQKSGGSILGDKTRMETLSANPHAFVRPSPSSGTLGGVADKTREAILLCEAAGYDVILVETVGVGQSEITVKSMVDFFMLLMLSGAGDELQGIKRGIMEMADLIAITKADGNNILAARKARTTYKNAIHLFPPNENEWITTVLSCSALTGDGLEEIWNSIESFKNKTTLNGSFELNRKAQASQWMHEALWQQIRTDFYSSKNVKSVLNELEEQIRTGETSPISASKILLKAWSENKNDL